ncbi:hypothetical protein [Silvimonas amylolytica]|uniref:PIN domain-containing protein n=1 Tax=Silvimonas amylolytica TaxID=449663 RepID=A0ABQ2PKC7_9NEIS|nr:hypothetical protein [Silvimonas amylolytica]GGP25689.1 hypothetical protein GCM10010971_15080 [Silvimonas amylolytica]
MSVVIDPPLFVPVFKVTDQAHANLSDLLSWLKSKNGKIVFGGKLYAQQLQAVKSVLPHLAELGRAGKITRLNDDQVDAAQLYAEQNANCADFDDAHLVAIAAISRAKVVCVNDPRCHRFLKRRDLYYGDVVPPKIFTGNRNRRLLRNV